jgi:hypothetical protein
LLTGIVTPPDDALDLEALDAAAVDDEDAAGLADAPPEAAEKIRESS